MKWAVRLLASLTLTLLVAAGVAYHSQYAGVEVGVDPDEQAAPFALVRTDFVLSDIEPGRHELVVSIANPANVPRQIIGLGEG